ncbi:glycosyltransferase family 4 protein [Anabaena sp. UHCC 0204]|uniref:glycosyltransferase family 4 protein n=1 Tax=Anabaena sp. UHCC 0204 TaxID=2590009 RepID=UPI00352F5EEC
MMDNTVVHEKRIHHCSSISLEGGGGLETYITSLINSQIYEVSKNLITSLKNMDQSQYKLLHFHDREMLMEWKEECPAVFTLHNHSSYCPSGTKYLTDRQKQCDRMMNPLGCTWGHLVDGCGSRRIPNIAQNLWSTYHPFTVLKKLSIPIIANSHYVKKQIIKNGISPHRVITLPCGVQQPKNYTEPLTKNIHQQQRILFVGRIVPDKGIEWLIKCLANTDQRIYLDIAGDGWAKSDMEKLVDQMGLSHRIKWHGWCQGEALAHLYHQCFAVVFPSLWPEPAGLVTLEAYAHYRPVIASAVGGIPEYVKDGKTGILVSHNHISQLSDAIAELATNYQKSRLMGEQGQILFQQEFTIEVHIQRLMAIYSQTITDFEFQN